MTNRRAISPIDGVSGLPQGQPRSAGSASFTPDHALPATHLTRAEAKQLSLSILGWGTIGKPKTAARMQQPPAYSGKFGEVALHRNVGELLEVYERQGRLIAIPVPNGAMLAGSDATQRARRAVRMKNDRQIRPGVSDWLVLIKNGPLLALELKAGKNKPTEEQAVFASAIELMGGLSFVCRSIAEVVEAISRGECHE